MIQKIETCIYQIEEGGKYLPGIKIEGENTLRVIDMESEDDVTEVVYGMPIPLLGLTIDLDGVVTWLNLIQRIGGTVK